jgi:metal-responsive CopG/Arc/MetJ family transcriptional regulator
VVKENHSKPIPTRFPDEEIERIDRIAKSSGLGTRSNLIKFCLKVFLDDMEERGQKALPRGWKEILEAMDKRTVASRDIEHQEHVAERSSEHSAKNIKRKRT